MMDVKNMKIAVVMGGPGSEHEVSLASGRGVISALQQLGINPIPVVLKEASISLPEDVTFVFNVVHGTYGEDGGIQEDLDKLEVAYTGEGAAESRCAFDKIATKKRFSENNVPTPAFEVLQQGDQPSLPVPYVIKAPKEGSSVGIFIVKSEEEAASALEQAVKFGFPLLVEAFIPGRELTVGFLGDQALPIIEICPKEGFYDFKNKYPFLNPDGGATHYCPAPLSEELTAQVQKTALLAKDALDLKVYGRVDILLTDDGSMYVLEINTIPGMTEASLLPEAAAAVGISYPELCQRMIELSATN